MSENEELSEAHWDYSKGIIEILTREYNPSKEIWLELNGYLYTKAMVHGLKHKDQDSNKSTEELD